ncbi:MAG TPA: hypothetical protein VK524_25655 [Polyangiaceae bacterium]|nr:hypothetical protein [Polyangiaceae bacterium]
MPKTNEDLEGYLAKLDRRFERGEDGTYLVAGAPHQPPIAVRLAPPVVVVRVEVGAVPEGDTAVQARLFRRLLELNASDLLHASYALDGNFIVLGSALELDNLDLNELEAVLADVDMAISEHVPALHDLVQKKV